MNIVKKNKQLTNELELEKLRPPNYGGSLYEQTKIDFEQNKK